MKNQILLALMLTFFGHYSYAQDFDPGISVVSQVPDVPFAGACKRAITAMSFLKASDILTRLMFEAVNSENRPVGTKKTEIQQMNANQFCNPPPEDFTSSMIDFRARYDQCGTQSEEEVAASLDIDMSKANGVPLGMRIENGISTKWKTELAFKDGCPNANQLDQSFREWQAGQPMTKAPIEICRAAFNKIKAMIIIDDQCR
jgi:hypothetical protein